MSRHTRTLHRAVVGADDCIDDAAWQHARDTKQHVGTCPRQPCGQPLAPGERYRLGPVDWYPAACTGPGCDYNTAAHGPRPARKKGS